MSEEVRLSLISRRRLFWFGAMAAAIAAPASILPMSDARAQTDQAPAAEPGAPKKKTKAKTTTKTKTKKTTPGDTTAPEANPPATPKQSVRKNYVFSTSLRECRACHHSQKIIERDSQVISGGVNVR